jgi:hypothetical protein
MSEIRDKTDEERDTSACMRRQQAFAPRFRPGTRDHLLLSFAVNFNLCRCTKEVEGTPKASIKSQRYLGRVVQVEPMQAMLKAPGTKRLKLQYDEPPSNFAFKFQLRRYTSAYVGSSAAWQGITLVHFSARRKHLLWPHASNLRLDVSTLCGARWQVSQAKMSQAG